MFSLRIGLLALSLIGSVASARSQTATQPAQAEQRKTSNPYKGDLSIFESPGRAERLQINRVMDILGVTAGKNVADIGAGSGWFTVRAAKRVGPKGLVYAIDINPEAIHYISERASKEKLTNVKTVLGEPDNPTLPTSSVDAVLMLKAYHEIAHPVVLLINLRAALRPGAKIGIIDRNGNGEDHGIGSDVVIHEAQQAGYALSHKYDFVKDGMDYFLVFTVQE
ncbi:MAG: class I SAM-dependent methyltransferase [Candidatus Sulfotelmatobacter sp.]